MSLIKYLKDMLFAKKDINAEINSYVEKGKYLIASRLAKENGFEELARGYYNMAIKQEREEIFLKNLKKRESYIPSKKCHSNIIENARYCLSEKLDRITLDSPNYLNSNKFYEMINDN